MQPRYKSWGAWLSLILLGLLSAKVFFNYELPQADIFITRIMEVGIAWGIWNNPTNGEGY